VARPADWVDRVNRPQGEAELTALHQSVQRSCPFGDTAWRDRTPDALGLTRILRPQG
jgi:hypothetical protein